MSVYESIIKGLNEAIEYESGTGNARVVKCTVNPVPDFQAEEIRDVRLSMGVSVKTVEAWEAGTNKPVGSARRLLSFLQSDPGMISRLNVISA